MEEKRNLSLKEKIAYGIGAVGKDMVYMLSATYILYYYQDIMGVSAWVMGIILLVARIFDAFNDPLMGVLVAKTKSKWGKFRPWLFIGTLTNALVLFFMFAAPPSMDSKGLVAYAAILYVLWGVTYTMMDIPFWSMVPAFTNSGKDREDMSALGRTCAGVGSAIITVVTVITVAFLGNMAAGKSADRQTISLPETSVQIVKLDQAGAPTGDITELTSESVVNVTANKKEFADSTSFNGKNTTFTIYVGEDKYTEKDGSFDFAYDAATGESVLVVYVSPEVYDKVDEGTVVNADIASKKETERLGFKWFSLIVAVLFFVFIFITCAVIKEKSSVEVPNVSVKEMFKALLQNDQAMVMVVTIVMVNSATYITSNLLIYFFKYDLAGANWEGNYTIFTTFGGAVQILAMMILFPIFRKFFDSLKMFYICVYAAVAGYVILLVMALIGINSVFPFFVPGFLIFAAVGVLNVLITVFLANTVDYGELKNHRRDESVIFSMQTFVVKFASGIAALIASLCLTVFNISDSDTTYEAINGSYVAGIKDYLGQIALKGSSVVSNSSVFGLRIVMTVLPIIVLIIGITVFKKKYMLNDTRLADINRKLAARKAEEAAAAGNAEAEV